MLPDLLAALAIHERPRCHSVLPYAVVASQLIDAEESSRLLRRPGTYERNLIVRPFSHGGLTMYAVGFALQDALRFALVRHASCTLQTASSVEMLIDEAVGIGETAAALRH